MTKQELDELEDNLKVFTGVDSDTGLRLIRLAKWALEAMEVMTWNLSVGECLSNFPKEE